jgi:hypothetical protein
VRPALDVAPPLRAAGVEDGDVVDTDGTAVLPPVRTITI